MESPPAVRILGRYALHGAIAAGGMATVHYGRLLGAVGFARTVAIKRLHPQFASDPEFVSMFVDEARLASRVHSPHVVATLDVVTTSGELFLVMEYVAGESLAHLVRAAGEARDRIPVPVAVAVMSGVLRGLHAAHEARNERDEALGIVHRDVSPQNVLVGSDGLSRVLDFGVAKATGRLQTTREGQIKGKLGYMGPEQLRADPVTRTTDVYAAAVVLWELLVGDRLFRADSEGAIVTRVLQGNIMRPSRAAAPGLPPREAESQRLLERLDPIVMRGLDRDPTKRFQSAREMAIALEECIAQASPAQVGEWVEKLVGPVLAERAARIAAIERGDEPAAPSATPAATQPTQASSISVSTTMKPDRKASSRRAFAVGAMTAIVVVLPLAVYLGTRAPAGVAPVPASSAASIAASSGSAAEPVSASSEPALAGASTRVDPTAEPSLTPPVPSSTIVSPTRRAPRAPPRPNDCNPPFTWDSLGKKHYKSNCL